MPKTTLCILMVQYPTRRWDQCHCERSEAISKVSGMATAGRPRNDRSGPCATERKVVHSYQNPPVSPFRKRRAASRRPRATLPSACRTTANASRESAGRPAPTNPCDGKLWGLLRHFIPRNDIGPEMTGNPAFCAGQSYQKHEPAG